MQTLLKFGLTSFVTLLVIVDPFGLVPIFTSLTCTLSAPARKAVAARGVLIALAVALFFLAIGHAALDYLGITVQAFSISGGILLFFTAMPMLFGQRGSLQSTEQAEPGADDIAVFPIAIPLLAGPGALTSILLLTSQTGGKAGRVFTLVAAVLAVHLVTWFILRAGERVTARVGDQGVHVVTRVMGIVLAGLAVQFVLNGVAGYCQGLHVHP